MDKIDLKHRTRKFSVEVINFIEKLPRSMSVDVLSKQLLRSATSVGANYRSACRGKSIADFINKIIICEEEADGSVYWIELMEEADLVKTDITSLKREANELTAIFTAIGKTAKQNQKNLKFQNSNLTKSEINDNVGCRNFDFGF